MKRKILSIEYKSLLEDYSFGGRISPLIHKIFQFRQFAGVPGRLLIHEKRAVGRHPADEEGLLEGEGVHFRQIFLVDDGTDDRLLPLTDFQLLICRRDAQDFCGPRRQFLKNVLPPAAKQNGFHLFPQLVQMFVPQDLAALIGNAVSIEETEGRSQEVFVDKTGNGEEIFQAVFERRPGEDQGKGRSEGFDNPAGFGLPVFDPLPLIQDDEVPGCPFDQFDVPDNLFIIADRDVITYR